MKAHQQRVIDELSDLDEKRDKLSVFLEGELFKTIDSEEQTRLSKQAEIMTDYSKILKERISNFQGS